jgi:hypothetical protein
MDGPGYRSSLDQIPGLTAAADLLKPEYHGRVVEDWHAMTHR